MILQNLHQIQVINDSLKTKFPGDQLYRHISDTLFLTVYNPNYDRYLLGIYILKKVSSEYRSALTMIWKRNLIYINYKNIYLFMFLSFVKIRIFILFETWIFKRSLLLKTCMKIFVYWCIKMCTFRQYLNVSITHKF